MAKITFVIEDTDNGVSTVATPSIYSLVEKSINTGFETPAENYAKFLANQMRERSKELKKKDSPIIVPEGFS